jgi:mRNA interferase RelE/StbE
MSYRVWIDGRAVAEVREAPGNIRQRIKRAMVALGGTPRPADSKSLEWPPERFEPRRLKMGNWRIIYAVYDSDGWVWVLAVRRRPPYDYGDLARLLDQIR